MTRHDQKHTIYTATDASRFGPFVRWTQFLNSLSMVPHTPLAPPCMFTSKMRSTNWTMSYSANGNPNPLDFCGYSSVMLLLRTLCALGKGEVSSGVLDENLYTVSSPIFPLLQVVLGQCILLECYRRYVFVDSGFLIYLKGREWTFSFQNTIRLQ
jgi:hypothetical protein